VKTVEYWLARFVLATLSSTSLATAHARARFYVRVLDLALPRLRRTALKNLEMAGFAGRERITTGVFDSIARLVVSFARFPRITRENVQDLIRYEGLENFQQAHSLGKGVLVATFSGIMSACFAFGLTAGDPIKEIAIVADDDHRAGIVGQHFLQQVEGFIS